MVISGQISMVDIHTKKKKESICNTKDSHQITREKITSGKMKRRPTKANPKQITKWQ